MERDNIQYTPDMLSQLPRADLRRMLATELSKPTSDSNDEFVRLLLAELQQRGDDPAYAEDEAVEAACEKFLQDTKASQKRWYQSRMLKAASVILVLGILFFALPASTQARDINGVLTWWSESAFRLFHPGKQITTQPYMYETNHPGLQQIYDAVTELGISEPIVPRKLSGEYTLTELRTDQVFEDTFVYACLASGNNEVLFTVTIQNKQALLQHEKNAENASIWSLAGIEHYVVSNNEDFIITWVTDNIECTITTDLPEEDVFRLINSIYTSEG